MASSPEDLSEAPAITASIPEFSGELTHWQRDWNAHLCDASVLEYGDSACLGLEERAAALAEESSTALHAARARSQEIADASDRVNEALTLYVSAHCDADRTSACSDSGAAFGSAVESLADVVDMFVTRS